jgi:hypothetical protein
MDETPSVTPPNERTDILLAGGSFATVALGGPFVLGRIFPIFSFENVVLAASLPGAIIIGNRLLRRWFQRRANVPMATIPGGLVLWGLNSLATLFALIAFLITIYLADEAHRIDSFAGFAYVVIIVAGVMCVYCVTALAALILLIKGRPTSIVDRVGLWACFTALSVSGIELLMWR